MYSPVCDMLLYEFLLTFSKIASHELHVLILQILDEVDPPRPIRLHDKDSQVLCGLPHTRVHHLYERVGVIYKFHHQFLVLLNNLL